MCAPFYLSPPKSELCVHKAVGWTGAVAPEDPEYQMAAEQSDSPAPLPAPSSRRLRVKIRDTFCQQPPSMGPFGNRIANVIWHFNLLRSLRVYSVTHLLTLSPFSVAVSGEDI